MDGSSNAAERPPPGDEPLAKRARGDESEKAAALVDSQTRAAVLRQIEHYLGDDNLSRDAFLRKQMDKNNAVPLKLLADFPRMKVMCPSASAMGGKTWAEIVAAIVERDSGILKVASPPSCKRSL